MLVAGILLCLQAGAQCDLSKFKPADKQADESVVNLYRNMAMLSPSHIMLGHQDALSYGAHWKGDPDRSDLKDLTGSHPAVFGWELGGIELGKPDNLDSVPFAKMRENIILAFLAGGINTISWHAFNPLTGKDSWADNKTANITVVHLLPGGSHHDGFKKRLDKIADFLQSLKSPDGKLIPVIFRPWHENSGNWFWWGASHCSAEEYKALYRFTIDYLRNTHHLHNLLIAYSPDVGFKNASDYLERYPGDDLVDIIGVDDYNSLRTGHPEQLIDNLEVVASVARDHHKLCALTETGIDLMVHKDYFTKELLPCLDHSDLTRSISWVLFWRNAMAKQLYLPDPTHPSARDFLEFRKSKLILMQNDIPDLYKYHKDLKGLLRKI